MEKDERRVDFPALFLSSVTLLVMSFLLWELLERRFFQGMDLGTIHSLYISRGILTGLIMAAWAAWFVLRQQRIQDERHRRMQAQLFQAEKLSALGELVSGLAHEINNPIGILSSRLELMLQDAGAGGAPEQLRKDLEVLRRQTARITDTTRNLLNFARQAPLEKVPVDMSEAAGNVLRLVQDMIKKQGIQLTTRLSAGLPPVSGCQNHLEQVILNLVKNAMEALEGRPDPAIQVATWYDAAARKVRLHVSDNGMGISSSALRKVFDPFFTTKEKGTGLGLSVSYGIVRQHGGELSIPSTGVDRLCGTCFMVSLPAVEQAKKQEASLPRGAQAYAGKR